MNDAGGTTNTLPPPTLEEYGKALVELGKRQQTMGLILQMPEDGVPEVLERLAGIYEFYRTDAQDYRREKR